jgi:hypothetical protein
MVFTKEIKKRKGKDITGKKFNRLTAIKPTNKPDKFPGIIWELKCDCGKIVYKRMATVISGHTKSCGCWKEESFKERITGKNQYNWKGDGANYFTKHAWMTRWYGQPKICEHCGTNESKKYEWANISGKYKRERSDWIRLCSKCHHSFDNISIKSWETRRKKELEIFKMEIG